MKIIFKLCTEDDLPLLQLISKTTFDESFRLMNTAETMERYLLDAFNVEKLKAEVRNPDSGFYFIYVNDELTGYIKLNNSPAQTDINDPDSLEIERIYIKKEFKGRGYGKRLMDFALQKAAALNKKYVWLGVWERNADAIAFYKKAGFYESGRHTFRMGDELQSDYIMKKNIED